jgi:uncharacterized OsmC-like protein
MIMSQDVTIHVTRQEGYRFLMEFGPQYPTMIADEPSPLGADSGPSPQHFLAAAIANCLCASLTFACGKYHEDPGELTASVTCHTGRNEQNRLRVTGLDVSITIGGTPDLLTHLERALASFESFCTVTESVRQGIPVSVGVFDPAGARLR